MNDLIERGTKGEMDEKDVPELSPSFQSKPVFERWLEYSYVPTPPTSTNLTSHPDRTHATLLRQLIFSNTLDLILDFSLTFVSVLCNYSSPLFLKLILSEIETTPDPHKRSKAYIYAILMFLASVAKAEADVLHLWHGRRTSTRIRSELMAAIYVKALRRKDFSGVTTKKDGDDKKDEKSKKKREKEDGKSGSKGGADTGKIVQLMAAGSFGSSGYNKPDELTWAISDANRISNTNSALYMIYSAPMEIVIASYMLYR